MSRYDRVVRSRLFWGIVLLAVVYLSLFQVSEEELVLVARRNLDRLLECGDRQMSMSCRDLRLQLGLLY